MSNLLVSLGHTGRSSAALGHTLKYTATCHHKKPHNVLSKFTIWCWAACGLRVGHPCKTARRADVQESSAPDITQAQGHYEDPRAVNTCDLNYAKETQKQLGHGSGPHPAFGSRPLTCRHTTQVLSDSHHGQLLSAEHRNLV